MPTRCALWSSNLTRTTKNIKSAHPSKVEEFKLFTKKTSIFHKKIKFQYFVRNSSTFHFCFSSTGNIFALGHLTNCKNTASFSQQEIFHLDKCEKSTTCKLQKKLTNKFFGYLARCEGKTKNVPQPYKNKFRRPKYWFFVYN